MTGDQKEGKPIALPLSIITRLIVTQSLSIQPAARIRKVVPFPFSGGGWG
jgi:hypothetical protein